jgi:thiamine transport system permease protein
VWREIDLPIGARGLMVGVGFAFAVSLGEFGATAFLPRQPDQITAPVALFRLLTSPGDLLRGQAMALSVVLMGLAAFAVLLLELGSSNRRGTF